MKTHIFALFTLLHLTCLKETIQQSFPFIDDNICKCPADNILNCVDFQRFEQLNFTQTDPNADEKIFDFLQLHPSVSVSLDEKVNFEGIFSSSHGSVDLANIASFHININPFKNLVKQGSQMDALTLRTSSLQFKYFDELLFNICRLELIEFSLINSIFSSYR